MPGLKTTQEKTVKGKEGGGVLGVEFLAEEQKIIDDIASSDLDLNNKKILIERVMGHSIMAGLDLADRLGLDRYEKLSYLSLSSVTRKHRNLRLVLPKFITENLDNINSPEQLGRKSRDLTRASLFRVSAVSPKTLEFEKRIDDYYANFMKLRSLSLPKEQPNASSPTERAPLELAQEQLLILRDALKENYYFGGFVDIFWSELLAQRLDQLTFAVEHSFINEKDIREKYSSVGEYFEALKNGKADRQNFFRFAGRFLYISRFSGATKIDFLEIKELFSDSLLDFNEEIKQKLRKYRYKPLAITTHMRGDMAKKGLVGELNVSLAPLGQEVVFDQEKGKYLIVEKKAETTQPAELEERHLHPDVQQLESYDVNVPQFDRFYLKRTRIVGEKQDLAFTLTGAAGQYFIFQSAKIGPIDSSFLFHHVLDVRGHAMVFVFGPDRERFLLKEDGTKINLGNGVHEVFESNGFLHTLVNAGEFKNRPIYNLFRYDENDMPNVLANHVVSYEKFAGDQIALIVQDGEKVFCQYPDGRGSKRYEYIREILKLSDQYYLITENSNKSRVIYPNGLESPEYEAIYFPTIKLRQPPHFFIGRKKEGQYVIFNDKSAQKVEAKDITQVGVFHGKAVFVVQDEFGYHLTDFAEFKSDYFVMPLQEVKFSEKDFAMLLADDTKTRKKSDEKIREEIFYINGQMKFKYCNTGNLIKFKDNFFVVSNITHDAKSYEQVSDDPFIYFPGDQEPTFFDKDVSIMCYPELQPGEGELYFFIQKRNSVQVLNSKKEIVFEKDGLNWLHIQKVEEGFLFFIATKDGVLEKYLIGKGQKEKEKTKENYGEHLADRYMLEILNLLQNPTLEGINRFLAFSNPEHNLKGNRLSVSMVNRLNKILKTEPLTFMNTIAAVESRENDLKSIINRLFPEVVLKKAKEKSRVADYLKKTFLNLRGKKERSKASGLFQQFSTSMKDGNPLEKNGETALELRDVPNQLIILALYGKYNVNTRMWDKANFPIALDLNEPVREYTFTLPNIDTNVEVALPMLVGARMISERIRGIKKDGTEIDISHRTDATGQVIVNPNKEIQKIVYSLSISEVPASPRDISQKDYDNFKHAWIRDKGLDLIENITKLSPACLVFLESIKNKTPKEQLILIENFVRDIGYYDMDNGEIQNSKDGVSLEDRFEIMEARMQTIKQSDPSLKDKKYAGVCSDFNSLLVGMLRKAGFVSGMSNCFMPKKILKATELHAVAYAVWPSSSGGKFQVVTLDGTPGSASPDQESLISQLQQKSLADREKEHAVQEKELLKNAEAKLTKIEEALANYDKAKIEALTNGELESVLNIILQYRVKESHYVVVETVCNVLKFSKYSILHEDNPKPPDFSDLDTKVKFLNYLDKNIINELRLLAERDAQLPAGEKFIELFRNTARTFVKYGTAKDTREAYEKLKSVFDMVGNRLDQTERRAVAVTLNYLQAKKVA